MPWAVKSYATVGPDIFYCSLRHTSSITSKVTSIHAIWDTYSSTGGLTVSSILIGVRDAHLFQLRIMTLLPVEPPFLKKITSSTLGGGLQILYSMCTNNRVMIQRQNPTWKHKSSFGCAGGIIVSTIEHAMGEDRLYVDVKWTDRHGGLRILDFQVTTDERYGALIDQIDIDGSSFSAWLQDRYLDNIVTFIDNLQQIVHEPFMRQSRPSGRVSSARPSSRSRNSGQRGGHGGAWVSTGRRATLKDGSRRTVFRNDRGEERVRRTRNQKQVYVRFEEAATPRG